MASGITPLKPGLMGHKVGHHIIVYRKHRDGSIWVVRILHERMDYQRHLKATYGP